MNDLPMAIQSVPVAPGPDSGRFYVDFEVRVQEDRLATIKAGNFVGRDVDFAIITLPGGKDVRRRPVNDALLNEWRNGTWRGQTMVKPPAPWAIHRFEQWKAGQEIPENGWALRHWNALSPAQLKTCIAANVRTVEDLAGLNDDGVKRLGIGGLQLVRLAREALKQKDGQKDTHRLVSLEQDVERLTRQVRELVEVNGELKRQIETGGNGLSGPVPDTPHPDIADKPYAAIGGDPAAEYERVFGKKPHHKLKPETMRKRIEEKRNAG